MDIIIRNVEEKHDKYKVKYKDGGGGHFYIDKQTAESVSKSDFEPLVMPKIADNWLNHKCINNACWFHGLNDKNCGNPEFENETIAGCAPRTQHKMMLNGIVGKEKADKISNESNFAI